MTWPVSASCSGSRSRTRSALELAGEAVTTVNLNYCDRDCPVLLDSEGHDASSTSSATGCRTASGSTAGLVTATEGGVIDYSRIYADITTKIVPRFPKLKQATLGYDPAFATDLATQLRDRAGLKVVEVLQNYTHLSEPAQVFEALVKAGRVTHGGHRVLRHHVENVAVKTDDARRIRPVKPKKRRQAHRRRRRLAHGGEDARPGRRATAALQPASVRRAAMTITRDSLTLFGAPIEKPRGGRPRVAEPMAPISVRFKPSEHDQIIQAANARGMTVTGFMRAAVLRATKVPVSR